MPRHVHAHLMAAYARDALQVTNPWEMWQFRTNGGNWVNCQSHPTWNTKREYRHKPKDSITVNWESMPAPNLSPVDGQSCFVWDNYAQSAHFIYFDIKLKAHQNLAEQGLLYDDKTSCEEAANVLVCLRRGMLE